MCRLFGLHAGRVPATATFWLLDAPDNLSEQSRHNPDGTGIGVFEDGTAVVDKQPIAAWEDKDFAVEAHELRGTTFVAHVRYASTGAHTEANTHPFLQDGRIFAHNGVVGGLATIDARLAELGATDLVRGQTDSERVFALITAAIRPHGDVERGLVEAMRWVADNVEVFAANILLATATDLWALRYPQAHELHLLDRRDTTDTGPLHLRSDRIRAHSRHLTDSPSVVLASEPMDDDPRWYALEPGMLVHVDADLGVTRRIALPDPPRHQLSLADLTGAAATSQHEPATSGR